MQQALKILVISMGALIILGLGLLIYGLAARLGGPADAPPAAAGTPRMGEFGQVRTALPTGASVGTIAVEGGRVVVPVLLPGGGAEIMVFGLEDGRRLGSIALDPTR